MTNTEKELLRRNVKELNVKIDELRKRLGIEQEFTTADGWAMPVENPDALHIKENKDD